MQLKLLVRFSIFNVKNVQTAERIQTSYSIFDVKYQTTKYDENTKQI